MSRAKKWVRALGGVLGLAALGSVGWILVLLGERDSRLPTLALTLEAERARARLAGIPRSFDDLPKRPTLRDDQNAAPFVREAVAVLPRWSSADALLLRRALNPTGELSVPEQSKVVRLLSRGVPALKIVREGLRRPVFDFGWHTVLTDDEWKQRRETLLACDRLAQLLQLGAKSLVAKEPDEALAVLAVVEQLTTRLTHEDGLLVWWSRVYHKGVAMQILDELGRKHPERLSKVEQAEAHWEIPPGVLKRTWMLQCVKEQSDSEINRNKVYKTDQEPFLDYNPLWRELDRLDHQLGWQLYANVSEVINLRYWRRVKTALQPLDDADLAGQWRVLKTLDTDEDRLGKGIPGYWYPQRYSVVAGQLLAATVQQQLIRLKRAGLPTRAVTQDPFSPEGRPFVWSEGKLYSVGPDEKDDGGDARKDIVLLYEKSAVPSILRSRRGSIRRPGRLTGQAE